MKREKATWHNETKIGVKSEGLGCDLVLLLCHLLDSVTLDRPLILSEPVSRLRSRATCPGYLTRMRWDKEKSEQDGTC